MSIIRQSNFLVTGGDSGLGKAIVSKAFQHGAATVVIWSRNVPRLNAVSKEFRQKGFKVMPYVVDVSDANQILTAAKWVIDEVGIPHVIINNAGTAVTKDFADHSVTEISETMLVNALGPMILAKAFLPGMLQRGSGHIVNIASAAGLTPNPKMSVYAASKWALIGWSESLRIELEKVSGNIHVTTVTPGYLTTSMFKGAKAPYLTWLLDSEKLAEAIIRAVKQNKIILRQPFTIHLLPLFRGLLPTRLYDFLVGKGFRIYTALDQCQSSQTCTTNNVGTESKRP